MALFGGIMTLQMNTETDMTATSKLKNYLNFAVHDAGLALDEQQLGQGLFVFDQAQEQERILSSLEYHLRATRQSASVLVPNVDSFFQENIEITVIDYIDDNLSENPCNGQLNTDPIQFPCFYENDIYDLKKVRDGEEIPLIQLHGQGIVIIVETDSPRYFKGEPIPLIQGSSYEYKR